jgi:uncharacterized membrane protein YkgB
MAITEEDFFKNLALEQAGKLVTSLMSQLNNAQQQQQDISQKLDESKAKINKALEIIFESDMDEEVKKSLLESIRGLQKLLVEEKKLPLRLEKYHALADMLFTVVVNKHASLLNKNESMNKYMSTFSKAPSKVGKAVRIAGLVSVLALGVGLGIAMLYIVPLIPIVAILTSLGMSGGTLTTATTVTTMGLKFGVPYVAFKLAGMLFNKIADKLGSLVAKFCSEYKTAAKIQKPLLNALDQGFFTNPKSDVKEELEESLEKDSEHKDDAHEPFIATL